MAQPQTPKALNGTQSQKSMKAGGINGSPSFGPFWPTIYKHKIFQILFQQHQQQRYKGLQRPQFFQVIVSRSFFKKKLIFPPNFLRFLEKKNVFLLIPLRFRFTLRFTSFTRNFRRKLLVLFVFGSLSASFYSIFRRLNQN